MGEGGADRLGGFPDHIVQVSRAIANRSMQLHGNEARLVRYDLASRLESVQEGRFVGGIDREEVDEHDRRGRDTELAIKWKFFV